MKKGMLLTIAAVFTVSFMFNSCSKEEVQLLGYWKCTGIGANVLGNSTGSIGEDYLKYFSVGYAGTSTGKYVRVGVDDFSSLASTGISTDIWKEFLSTGSYACDVSSGTITHTSSNGEARTYSYTVTNNGKTLKLVEQKLSLSSSGVNSALNILNSFLGTNAQASAGVEYTYEKLNSLEAFNSLISK